MADTVVKSVGIRAEPRGFWWAASEGTLEVPILTKSEHVAVPANYTFAEGANFLRLQVLQLLRAEEATHVGLRTPETVPKSTESLRERLRVEGVLLAAAAEHGAVITQGPLATLNSLLGSKSAKAMLEKDDLRGIDVSEFKKEKREAILMSVSLLPREK